jgi:hypothetical protein
VAAGKFEIAVCDLVLVELAMEFAVNVGAVATPLWSVRTVAELENAPPAPLDGGVNVTDAPWMGLLLASRTVAFRAAGKAVLIVALWPPPAVAVMVPGGPGLFVRPKVAGVPTPVVVAVTL